MLAQYLKECLLEARQIPTCVSNPPEKPITKNKIEPLGSQIVRPKNGQPKVTLLEYLIMPSGTKKCQFQHVLLHPKK